MHRLLIMFCLSSVLVQMYHCDPIPADYEDDETNDLADEEYSDDDESKRPDDNGSPDDFDLGDDIIKRDEAEDGVATRSFQQDRLWPVNEQGLVEIPYKKGRLDNNVRLRFHKYIEEFEKKSCIRWVRWTNQPDFVKVVGRVPKKHKQMGESKYVCYADVGLVPYHSERYIMISKECTRYNDKTGEFRNAAAIPHEMMHILGFFHEHSRRDRDCYLKIRGVNTNNHDMKLRGEGNDEIAFPYDYNSIMHYRSRAFVPLHGSSVGPKDEHLSKMDWIKLNWVYCTGQHALDLVPNKVSDHLKKIQDCNDKGLINVTITIN